MTSIQLDSFAEPDKSAAVFPDWYESTGREGENVRTDWEVQELKVHNHTPTLMCFESNFFQNEIASKQLLKPTLSTLWQCRTRTVPHSAPRNESFPLCNITEKTLD